MITNPAIRRISEIRRVIAPQTVEKSIPQECLIPHQVLYAILEDPGSYNPLQSEVGSNKLFQLNPPGARRIHNKMASQHTIVTRVHAELQVADHFSRYRTRSFVDNVEK